MAGQFVAVGASGKLATSPDGVNWTQQTSSFSATAINGVGWSPTLGLFVAVGASGLLATSPDGVNWTQRTSSFAATAINGVGWSPTLGLFVAIGDTGKLATSPDGVNWTQRTSGHTTANIRGGVVWSPDLAKFAIAGSTGPTFSRISTSADGINWGGQVNGLSTTLNGIAWSSELDLFVVVANTGQMATSPDGINWTNRTSSFSTSNILCVAWSPSLGLFVAGGVSGLLATSPDGVNWTQQTSSFTINSINEVAWSPDLGLFVAVGTNGKIATSPDGINWTQQTSSFAATAINGVAARQIPSVGRTLTARWDVRANVGRTLIARWDVRENVGRTLTARFDVRALAGRTLTARWDVRANVGRTLTARWDVRANAGATLTSRWNVRALAGAALTARFDVRANVGRTLTARWDVRSLVGRALTARWLVRQRLRPSVLLYIGGEPVTLQVDSLRVPAALGERTTATFVVLSSTGGRFRKGQPVEIINEDDTMLFAGIIDTPEEVRVGTAADPVFVVTVVCVGWAYRADKRLAAVSYVDELAGDIVRDLIVRYLSEEDITEGLIEDGPTIPAAVFPYIPVSGALDRLVAAAGGWLWWIDHDKRLHFHDRAAVAAPWEITPTDIIDDSARVSHGSRNYRNRQFIAGTDVTSPQTDTRTGDGETRSWSVAYPLDQVPTVSVDTVEQTVGIRGVDVGKDWYWNRGDNTVSQDSGATPLTSSEELTIIYRGQVRMLAMAEDPSAIDELRGVEEGGTGIVEQLADANASITSREAAFAYGGALLREHARFGRTLTFATERAGLVAGQWATVHLDAHDLDGVEMLLTAVELNSQGSQPYWRVTATEGPDRQAWARFFAGNATGLDLASVDVAALIILTSTSEAAGWSEDVEQTVYACPIPSATLYPSGGLYPC